MVTPAQAPRFDHRDAGTDELVWDVRLDAEAASIVNLAGVSRLIVLAAHPDDESLGAGGLLAAASSAGIEIHVWVATLGEASHPGSPTHEPADLARIRRRELYAALGEVAPRASVRILGLPDGGLERHLSALTRDLHTLTCDAATLVVAPWRGDGHPDHQAAGHAAAALVSGTGARLWEYPIWWWHWAIPSQVEAADLPTAKFVLGPDELRKKRAAMRAHVSQLLPLSPAAGDECIVPPDFAAHFDRPYESYFESAPAPGLQVGSLPRAFFDEFYGDRADPWGFETRWYEARKRALTLAALPRKRFAAAFEPGCSIGVLTAELAARCDTVLATDIAEKPLSAARQRLGDALGVRFEQRAVPAEWPEALFDLIVLSEIGYYCDTPDLALLISRAVSSLAPGGVILACHWRHPVADYPLRGDDVHAALRERSELSVLASHVEEDFLLDVFAGPDVASVARSEGLL
ncbi:methyltransferase domain-containing protein [Nakamurella antarctica]|uniref:Methyltransferase domain-containing protein n=1 Tax=Nakamurella antarctica TaxID=1902245 RepID=A0A3G8ZW51_9ACTN|nr:PIG-L family deacetylase [Nakamurella antarctica]AZI58674.1 methyltransferase domain-containing protein [Nakamurella antarctica]